MMSSPDVDPPVLLIAQQDGDERLLCEVIHRFNRETRLVPSGDEALSLCRQLKPNLILLDRDMSAANPVELCRRLRTEECGKDAVIVAVSADPIERPEYRKAGFDYCFRKPISEELIQSLLLFTRVTSVAVT